ncbi:hypothetical protein PFICI_02373 [Pestalotiopsis fici W106-1]|uniref:Uncharacterized protein n=1 Tax=Pestalotiopsis fici (strain W106-1 / CGMCC3.15140) TaxID=1229662 RepID=W3XE31_PESFW|nr:uncharacterized protein PFICI_02373 [Pestalotiopsis fici W106-1]ETS84348.1 hypothetical protein PFICI_02373 [Pestalotiopsis fici W106-1]
MLFPGVALVTGAGSGIGRQTALLLAQEGCSRIAIADINEVGVAETRDAIENLTRNVDILVIHLDVASEDSIKSMIDTTVGKFSRIDYACNVAGLCISGETVATSSESWDKLFQVNARGTWLCQKYEILHMQKQDPLESPDSKHKSRGSILNVSSMAGRQGQANLVAYGAAKHAVVGFTKADGMRYGSVGIRINAVCPGAIKTPMLTIFANERVGGHLDNLALQRLGDPEEIAECVVWLSSRRASYVTATTLSPHGGKKPPFPYAFYGIDRALIRTPVGQYTVRTETMEEWL